VFQDPAATPTVQTGSRRYSAAYWRPAVSASKMSDVTIDITAGIDEAGMGSLAGPVYAAAVILPPDHGIIGLRDSKRLTPRQRERLSIAIRQQALAWAVATATVDEIDQLNILAASWLAMARAVEQLDPQPKLCLVDGGQTPHLPGYQIRAIPHGDGQVEAIMAASILAKVDRDTEMVRLDSMHPGYGFAQNKGYPSPAGRAALLTLGRCPAHRRSFSTAVVGSG
jgi:ribonuclease HII